MNGNRRNADGCKVFVPDPWTFSEDAYPARYQGLIGLPRYLAKNYLDFSRLTVARKGYDLARTLLRSVKGADFVDGLRIFRRGFRQFGATNAVFIVFFEYLSAMAFIRAVEQSRPDAAIIFINMLAHVQHHYWKSGDGSDCPQIAFAAIAADEILGKLVARQGIVATAALRCECAEPDCTIEEPPRSCTAQQPRSPDCFLGRNDRAELLMTHDAYVFFAMAEATARGADSEGARIDGKPLFSSSSRTCDPLKLFYRVAMDLVGADAQFTIATWRHVSPIISPPSSSAPASTTRTAIFLPILIGCDRFSNHEASGWLEQSASDRDRSLTAA